MEELFSYRNCQKDNDQEVLKIGFEDGNIDILANYPKVKRLFLANIGQNQFEHIITNYGQQYEFIDLFHCPLISDFTLFSSLESIRYLSFDWNTAVNKLWNMSRNKNLRGMYLNGFTKLKDFNELTTAPCLKELFITGGLWSKQKINTLQPIGKLTELEFLGLNNVEIIDNDLIPISKLVFLKKLRLNEKDFPVENYAMLAAQLTKTECDCFKGYVERTDYYGDGRNIRIVGKRMPKLNKILDKQKIDKYMLAFEELKLRFS